MLHRLTPHATATANANATATMQVWSRVEDFYDASVADRDVLDKVVNGEASRACRALLVGQGSGSLPTAGLVHNCMHTCTHAYTHTCTAWASRMHCTGSGRRACHLKSSFMRII